MIPVSLGIPMFKSGCFLPHLFDTLLSLDPRPSQIILLDDASPDESHEEAMAFARRAPFPVTVLRNDTNQGIAAAYNRLARSAREDWIQILDADDFPVEKDYYARVGRLLTDDVSAVVTALASNSTALRIGNTFFGRLVPANPPRWLPLLGSFSTRSGVIYRRTRLLDHPFPEPAYPGSDIVHFLDLRTNSPIAFARDAHVFYRIHHGASSSQTRDFARYMDALKSFGGMTRLAYLADLVARRAGQMFDRS
jgi:glycosyltransferase involved in cell wall biosynthesis